MVQLTQLTPQIGQAARPHPKSRRGVASVIAMLYLVIFSALAVGFYSAVTMSVQIAHNDERSMNAQIAAESGLNFMRYHLSKAKIPGNTPKSGMLMALAKELAKDPALMPPSENVSGRAVVVAGDTIYVPNPADGYFIPLDDDGAGFRATVTDMGDNMVLVKVIGHYRGVVIARAIELGFLAAPKDATIFNFGVVTRGPVRMTGNASISGPDNALDGSVLSTYRAPTQTTMTGKASIGGDLYLVDKDAAVSFSGQASVGGNSNSSMREEHIHRGAPEPDFPDVDTSIFLPFVTNIYKPGQSAYTNVLVPANTNPNFSGKTTIEGVLYIKHPNRVSFSGQTTVRGIIVVENGASSTQGNSLKFSGGVSVEPFPENNPKIPPALRELKGSALLAPGFDVSLSGQSGVFGGAMVADSFTFTGGAGGNVDGTMIGLTTGALDLTGGGSIARRPSKVPIPAGLLLPMTYKPLPETYTEVNPNQ
jgi:hypothetical protein